MIRCYIFFRVFLSNKPEDAFFLGWPFFFTIGLTVYSMAAQPDLRAQPVKAKERESPIRIDKK